jgi:alkylation response protein AidB-like acyl-CoA dehydrogenase
MDFNFTDEQQMLRDSVEKFVREHYDASKASERRKLSRKAPGYNKEYWQTFADLGWLGVPFPEEYGGIGGTLMDSMVVMEELGKGLVQEPYFPTVILFGNCLLIAGSETQKQTLIPRIVAGEILGTLAYAEEQARGNMADVATTANKQDGGWVLNGVKSLVMNADSADYFVVSARTSGKLVLG